MNQNTKNRVCIYFSRKFMPALAGIDELVLLHNFTRAGAIQFLLDYYKKDNR